LLTMCPSRDRPLSVVGLRRKWGPVILIWTAWVQFLPSPTHETCLCCSAMSGLMKLDCLSIERVLACAAWQSTLSAVLRPSVWSKWTHHSEGGVDLQNIVLSQLSIERLVSSNRKISIIREISITRHLTSSAASTSRVG
jgi:hypothetical protein